MSMITTLLPYDSLCYLHWDIQVAITVKVFPLSSASTWNLERNATGVTTTSYMLLSHFVIRHYIRPCFDFASLLAVCFGTYAWNSNLSSYKMLRVLPCHFQPAFGVSNGRRGHFASFLFVTICNTPLLRGVLPTHDFALAFCFGNITSSKLPNYEIEKRLPCHFQPAYEVWKGTSVKLLLLSHFVIRSFYDVFIGYPWFRLVLLSTTTLLGISTLWTSYFEIKGFLAISNQQRSWEGTSVVASLSFWILSRFIFFVTLCNTIAYDVFPTMIRLFHCLHWRYTS